MASGKKGETVIAGETVKKSTTSKKSSISQQKDVSPKEEISDLQDTPTQSIDDRMHGTKKVLADSKEKILETIHVQGHQLAKTIKKILQKGHANRIVLKDASGKVILNIPITIGVVAVVLGPILAVVALVVSFFAKYTIEVITEENTDIQSDNDSDENIDDAYDETDFIDPNTTKDT